MKPTLLLRIAGVLSFLHGLLHAIGDYIGKPQPGAQLQAVSAMKLNSFVVMGQPRTFWDFYEGMSIAGSITLIVIGIVLWQLGSVAKKNAAPLRPVIATFAFAFLALAVNSYKFFIPPPVIMELVIAACLGLAAIGARRSGANELQTHQRA
jgi:hypothetical protein